MPARDARRGRDTLPGGMARRRWLAGVAGMLVGGSLSLSAQDATLSAPDGRRTLTAVRVTTPITVDGVLDEEIWRTAPPADGFVQSDPLEGEPATETTEVRVAFDDDYLYIAALCHDGDPAHIVVNDIRKDFAGAEQDIFEVLLDTFEDRRNGFVFSTNAAGARADTPVRQRGPRRQPELGRGVVGGRPDHARGLDGRVPHPVQDPALPARRRPRLGHQLRAPDPAEERSRPTGRRCRARSRSSARRRPAR